MHVLFLDQQFSVSAILCLHGFDDAYLIPQVVCPSKRTKYLCIWIGISYTKLEFQKTKLLQILFQFVFKISQTQLLIPIYLNERYDFVNAI
jgi:hypothetical protein